MRDHCAGQGMKAVLRQSIVEKRRAQRMKKLLTLFFTLSFMLVFVVACGQGVCRKPTE